MRKSQKNNSVLSRFVYYKYSGIIVFAPLIIIGVSVFLYMENEKEFFTAWSCETVGDYLLDIDVPDDIPNAHTLPEDQHLKLHKIHDECNSNAKFSEKRTVP